MRGLLHQAGTGFGRIPSMPINGLHPDMKRENGERKRPCHRPHRFPGRFAMIVYRSRCYFCQINVIKMVFRASPNKKGQHLKGGVNPRHRLCRHYSEDVARVLDLQSATVLLFPPRSFGMKRAEQTAQCCRAGGFKRENLNG